MKTKTKSVTATVSKEQIAAAMREIQVFDVNGIPFSVVIVSNEYGSLFAKFVAPTVQHFAPTFVPRDICKLAAGKDAWMRKIKFPCQSCGTMFECADQGDVPNECQTCGDAYFNCKKCGHNHHPDDGCDQAHLMNKAAASIPGKGLSDESFSATVKRQNKEARERFRKRFANGTFADLAKGIMENTLPKPAKTIKLAVIGTNDIGLYVNTTLFTSGTLAEYAITLENQGFTIQSITNITNL